MWDESQGVHVPVPAVANQSCALKHSLNFAQVHLLVAEDAYRWSYVNLNLALEMILQPVIYLESFLRVRPARGRELRPASPYLMPCTA